MIDLSPQAEPNITIGLVVKEKYNLAAQCLERLYQYTSRPFKLVIVDSGYPDQYWQELEAVIDGREHVKVLKPGGYLTANESRNLVLQETRHGYVCLFENDTLVEDDWLAAMIAACDSATNSVVIPLLYEGPRENNQLHVDWQMGGVEIVSENNKQVRYIKHGGALKADYGKQGVVQTESIEIHVLFAMNETFQKLGKFDEFINTREHHDFALIAHQAGVPIVLQPEARMSFYHAPSLGIGEFEPWDYFWDFEKSIVSQKYLIGKWNLRNLPMSYPVVRAQQYRQHPLIWELFKSNALPLWIDDLVVPIDCFELVERQDGEVRLFVAGVHRLNLNGHAAIIISMMNGELTLGDIFLRLHECYTEAADRILKDIYDVSTALSEAGLLVSIPLPQPEAE